MKQDKLQRMLERVGLSEKEALVYLSSLQLGPSTVQQLARASSVKRTSVYHVIDALVTRGLMRKELHGIKELLVAEDPSVLERLVKQQQEEFLDTLPYLRSLHQLDSSDSVIRHFEGLERVEAAYWEMIDTVRSGEDYLVLGRLESWAPLISERFAKDFIRKRGRLPISVRMMLCDGPLAQRRRGADRQPNEETKLLPSRSSLTTNLVITSARLFVHQYESPYIGMIIENKHIIQMHREMYEIMWQGLTQ